MLMKDIWLLSVVKWISRKTERNSTNSITSKRAIILDWTNRAEYYHCNWVSEYVGPFKVTPRLVDSLDVRPHDVVLDLACGTGAVSKEISQYMTGPGMLVGVDISRAALSIANSWIASPSNSSFLEMDAETLGFKCSFDKVACQYALMFFNDPEQVLTEIKSMMKKSGRIGVAVHGTLEGVPYFSSITQPVSKFIPEYPSKSVSFVHRFGKPDDLRQLMENAGFSNISIDRYVFEYEAASFDEYWSDFFSSGYGSPLQPIVFCKKPETISKIKSDARKLTSAYIRNDQIHFPWEVLIAVGRT